MTLPVTYRLFVDAKEAALMLNEGLTVFHSARGSRKHPAFPAPVLREGRKPQWLVSDIAAFAETLANEYRAESSVTSAAQSTEVPHGVGARIQDRSTVTPYTRRNKIQLRGGG